MKVFRRLLLAASGLVVALTLVVDAGGAGGARAQQATRLTLAPRYDVQRIDSPSPTVAGRFGQGLFGPGDIDRDGEDDLLVPQSTGFGGEVFVVSGATGRTIRTLAPPDASTGGNAATFFQFVGRIEDIGSCAGGQPSQTCPLNPIGQPDGVPDLLLSSPGFDFGPVLDIGRAYVMDGATGAVLKRIDMPAADRAAQADEPSRPKPGFGRTVLSPSSAYPADAPPAVKIGDLDGGGRPDVVVGASTYHEAGPQTNPACSPGPCSGSGRVYFYRGEDVAGSNPNAILDAPFKVLKNPTAQTDDPETPNTNVELFGHLVIPTGDIGRCSSDPGPGRPCPSANSAAMPDGRPDLLVSAYRTDFPPGFADTGVAYLIDGATGSVLFRFEHPEPQPGVLFSWLLYNQAAIGDVGDTTAPDVFLPALRQDVALTGQGRGYVFSGNFKTHPANMQFAQFDDPTPANGGNFGSPAAAVGDLAGDPRNEVLVGASGPFIPGLDHTIVNDVHFISPATGRIVLSVKDPDQQGGSGFGNGVASLGDVNDDGLLDFAVAAGQYDGRTGANEGRLYIFRSVRAPAGVQRRVTLSLQSHLIAAGRVSATPSTQACIASVPLVIERNGRAIRRSSTGAEGAFRVRIPDRAGRYRAVVAALVKDDIACGRATSAIRSHRH